MQLKKGIFFLFCSLFLTSFSQDQSSDELIKHKHSLNQGSYFLENKGQWPNPILFKSKIQAGNIWVQQHKLLFHLQDYSRLNELHLKPQDAEEIIYGKQLLVHLNFPSSNSVEIIEKENKTESYYNYFIGADKSKWTNDVHGYSEVTMKEFYNGIDLKLISNADNFKYEFHVQPNIDPSIIYFNYGGVKRIKLANNGNLIIETELGKIMEQKPFTYQLVNGKMKEVKSSFILKDNQVSFKIGKYDPSERLIIDPILVFATYSGSVTDNFGMTATYGYDGTAYSAGIIYGNQYPTPDPLAWDVTSNITIPSSNVATTDAFISKYSADGSTMLWTTFIGGGDNTQGTETTHSLICDQSNNIYMYGVTSSIDFPVQGGFQTVHNGGSSLNIAFNGTNFGNTGTDIFVAKFSANGQSLLGSTYVGGAANDGVNYKVTSGTYNTVAAYDSLSMNYGDQFRGEIMLDNDGNCIVASCSRSLNFPILNAFQSTNGGQLDGVIFKMSPNLNNLIWSSYYGGSNNDACYSVKIDSSSNIVFAGGTSSNNLPYTSGGFIPNYNGGKTDGFVAKINPLGTNILNATYLGTPNYDQAFFVEIDRYDNVFVLGQSMGGTFPVVNANFVNPGSSQFIIKLNPALNQNLSSTVFGNGSPSINISPAAFLVDICGNIYVSGWGANILQSVPLSGMPVTQNAFQQLAPNGFDFYLLVIKGDFEDILYGSYIGGSTASEHVDGGTSRFDKNGVVYQSVCGGCGGFSDFVTTPGAWSSQNLSSNCNNLIFKFDFQLIPVADFIIDNNIGCASFEVNFENFSTESDSYLWDFGNGDTSSTVFSPTIVYDVPGVYVVNLFVTDSICLLTDTALITVTVLDEIQLNTPDNFELCSPVELNLVANSFGTASYFIWSTSPNFTDTLNTSLSDSILTITPNGPTIYYVLAGNSGCFSIDSTVVDFIGASVILGGNTNLCLGDSTTLTVSNLNPNISFSYEWAPTSIIDSVSSNEIQISPLSSQYVYVTASSSNGCIVNDSIFINVSSIDSSSVVASASQYIVTAGSTVTLYGSPTGLDSYSWSPTTGVSDPSMQQTNALVNETTIYTLTVSDGVCTRSDTTEVKVYEVVCGDPYVFIPNAFSPNGDTENDVLYVRGIWIEKMIFRIFDRWGEMVFESIDPSIGWDGTFRGRKLDSDVYDFYLDVTCIGGLKSIVKGNVTLMK
ncbi:MAG: T9SS type B sorting domain-containing protein [Bacteroidetes bacterium]|nr:T9SS type B sorting domain-containing protein [Bacteroidota bacterium]